MYFFDRKAKMSQFGALWRSFTCGQLNELLNQEYPYTNLPMMIRLDQSELTGNNANMEQHFTFLGVVYRKKPTDLMPAVFTNPLSSDAVAYTEVRVFVPQGRIEWWVPPEPPELGGVPGQFPDIPSQYNTWEISGSFAGDPCRRSGTFGTRVGSAQLVPATLPNLAAILQNPAAAAGLR